MRFHNKKTSPIHTCILCYRKYPESELEKIGWDHWMESRVEKHANSPFACPLCFPVGEDVSACAECLNHLWRGARCPAGHLHACLGCEHKYSDELKGLTPGEEKLIALNSCYGFITKFGIPERQRQGMAYPKHVKGHITVFPNNVQELVTNVLPHPILKVMDEIHVSWQGVEKPEPSDLSALLSVRRRIVENALLWLKRHNHLYANIHIDTAELESWDTPAHGVPVQVYSRLERNEPSAWEKARTGQLVPSAELGLSDDRALDIREVLATLSQGHDVLGGDGEDGRQAVVEDEDEGHAENGTNETEAIGLSGPIHEISSSGMFALDGGPDVSQAEKLRSIYRAFAEDASGNERQTVQTDEGPVAASAEVRYGQTSEPYILLSRGEVFADSFDIWFFAKTFPTLFPFGRGGPRQADEGIIAREDGNSISWPSSRCNMSLEKWARFVIRRHVGHFPAHPIFAFLVFNLGVRSRNRRVSMLSLKRRNFAEVEQIVHSLSPERLEAARAELENTGRTVGLEVNQLLRSLSLYGSRQPMSKEDRLSMRRKIKSLIIRYGIPAIWFTINPNDITNPVKLRLAAYRSRVPEAAEAFLRDLDQAYKRARLAISDSLSSVEFFYREISMFFQYYVRVGEDSVFGRIDQYFGAVETNERGSLHLHGLLWLQGNMHLSSVFGDIGAPDQAAYRERIIQYVDSVFSEVCYCLNYFQWQGYLTLET